MTIMIKHPSRGLLAICFRSSGPGSMKCQSQASHSTLKFTQASVDAFLISILRLGEKCLEGP